MKHGTAWLARKSICWPTCKPCHDAWRKQKFEYALARSNGTRNSYIDLEPTRELLLKLTKRGGGFSITAVARETNTNTARIHDLIARRDGQSVVSAKFARQIEELYERRKTVTVGKVVEGCVSPTLSRLALEGLHLNGWTASEIARRTGLGTTTLSEILSRRTRYVSLKATQEPLVKLARELCTTQGPSEYTAKRSKTRGFRPLIMRDEFV